MVSVNFSFLASFVSSFVPKSRANQLQYRAYNYCMFFVCASRLRFAVLYSIISRSRYELYTKCWHTENVASRVNA